MKAMAKNLFNQGFIQFLSSMLIDPLESTETETYSVCVVKYAKNVVGIRFDEVSFLYDKANHAPEFKQLQEKFILFGVVHKQINGNEIMEIAPLKYTITEQDFALVLFNRSSIKEKLISENFEVLIDSLKADYFYSDLSSPFKFKRITTRRGEPGSNDSRNKKLKEPLLDSDNFQTASKNAEKKPKGRSFVVNNVQSKDILNKQHDSLIESIYNRDFKKIFKSSIKSMLNTKFGYIMNTKSHEIDVSSDSVKEIVSGHILILGYHKG